MVDRDHRHRYGPDATRYPGPGWSGGPPAPGWPPHEDANRQDGYRPDGYRPDGYDLIGYAPDAPPYRAGQPAPWARYGGPPTPEPRTRSAWGRRRLDASPWHWWLFVPVAVPLIVPLYNRVEPTLGGVPFYYWGQLAFALLSSAVVTIVHLATKGR